MGRFRDLIGQKFGRLTFVKYLGQSKWLCKCDCGNEKVLKNNDVLSGKVRSCGCLLREKTIERNYRHGLRHTRIYRIWLQMKNRCNNDKKTISYYNYRQRGIKVCEEWNKDFKTFYDWSMLNGYKDNLSIDRIDNNGCYCSENCRWVTKKEQNNNTRRNVFLEYNNEKHTVSEWAELLGFKQSCLRGRLKRGWSVEKTLTQKARTRDE